MKKSLITVALKWGALLGVALAACEVVKMVSRDINYDAGTVFSLLLLIVIILFLYASIKEYRDDVTDGYIRFPKAFGVGALTTVVAFVVVFAYMLIHYKYIDKEGLQHLNQRNVELFYAKLEKDTVSHEMAKLYLHKTDSMMTSTYAVMIEQDMIDTACADWTRERMDKMMQAYNDRVLLGYGKDSLGSTYAGFAGFAQHQFLDVYQNLLAIDNTDDNCYQSFSMLVNNSRSNMEQVNLLEEAYEMQKNKIPHYTSILPVAMSYAFSVLLYGLFLAIFVALYLTKKKEETPDDSDQGSGVSDQKSMDRIQNS
jgi:hypothetical protein